MWSPQQISRGRRRRRDDGVVALVDNLALAEASWNLEEVGGTRFDATANGHDLTDVNGLPRVDGHIGFCAEFKQPFVEHLTIPYTAALGFGATDWTIAAWVLVRTLGLSGGLSVILTQADALGSDTGPFLLVDEISSGVDRFRADFRNLGVLDGLVFADSFGQIVTGVFNLVVVTHDLAAGTLNISVNDGPVDSANTGAPPTDSLAPLGWGNRASGAPGSINHDGEIDIPTIWPTIKLRPDEITKLYNGGVGREFPFA